jgi:NADPH-dependent 2,4-dienoyl-CoA reductase/sulfur reductase-like enzyme
MAIVAIDQGTSGTKALVIGGDGEVLSRGYAPLDLDHSGPGDSECAAEDLWQSIVIAIKQALAAGAQISTSSTAPTWISDYEIEVTAPGGLEVIRARAIILATGARERARAARAVPGKRPAGIYTTGSLQQSTYLQNLRIGTSAVIVGAEHVSFSAVMTLAHAGVKTVAMITDKPHHETVGIVHWALAFWYRFKLMTRTEIVEVLGDKHITGVRIRRNGVEKVIACDTIVFTGDWIPENELVRRGGFAIDSTYKSPIVNANAQIAGTSIYAVGNLVLPIKAADKCAIDARVIAKKVAATLG